MPRKKIELSDHVRNAILDEIELIAEAAQRADEDKKIRVYLAREQGVLQADMASKLGVSTSVISLWSKQGEQARDRRRSERADRSGEREPVG